MARNKGKGPTGWAVFAGIMLFIVGSLNLIYGLAAVLNDEVVTVGNHGVLIWDFTGWGWIHMGLGGLMLLASGGLFAGVSWSRWVAVVFATLNAVAQVGLITAFPLFSILIVALDVLVIYNLTARWEDG